MSEQSSCRWFPPYVAESTWQTCVPFGFVVVVSDMLMFMARSVFFLQLARPRCCWVRRRVDAFGIWREVIGGHREEMCPPWPLFLSCGVCMLAHPLGPPATGLQGDGFSLEVSCV